MASSIAASLTPGKGQLRSMRKATSSNTLPQAPTHHTMITASSLSRSSRRHRPSQHQLPRNRRHSKRLRRHRGRHPSRSRRSSKLTGTTRRRRDTAITRRSDRGLARSCWPLFGRPLCSSGGVVGAGFGGSPLLRAFARLSVQAAAFPTVAGIRGHLRSSWLRGVCFSPRGSAASVFLAAVPPVT